MGFHNCSQQLVGHWKNSGFRSHKIEHELSAIYDVPHGAGLAVVFPAWMKYVYKHDINRFVKFATRVMGVEMDFDDPERTVLEGIEEAKKFLPKFRTTCYPQRARHSIR